MWPIGRSTANSNFNNLKVGLEYTGTKSCYPASYHSLILGAVRHLQMLPQRGSAQRRPSLRSVISMVAPLTLISCLAF